MIPYHITLASLLVDSLHEKGVISTHSAQALFDALADALALRPDVVQDVMDDMNLITEAFTNFHVEGE